MSKESVNRLLVAALALLLCELPAPPAAAQVVLVVGSVRDQHGTPVQGADVSGVRASGGPVRAQTDAAGTFALHADGIRAVEIGCRYCASATFAVRPGEPVVAIVRRYDALESDSPSAGDLANLPYAHVESSMALRPFTLLAQTTHVYPGARISDRGLSSSGSLLVDDGAPNYDIVTGTSPYATIPAGFEQTGEIADAGNAFLYGDQAGGGTVFLHPFSSGNDVQSALIGGDAIVRVQAGSDASQIALGSYSNSAESRQRADGSLAVPVAGDGVSLQLAGGTEQGRQYSSPYASLADSFTFADADFADRRLANLQVTSTLDRGGYTATYDATPTGTVWSDAGFDASVHSNAPLQLFAGVATRYSTGSYDAQAAGLPRIGATMRQTRADAGFSGERSVVRGNRRHRDVLGGLRRRDVGIFEAVQRGVRDAVAASQALSRGQMERRSRGQWLVYTADVPRAVSISREYPGTVALTRNSLFAGSLDYTDEARLRVSFEAATQSVRGAAFGTVTSAGLSATWQIAPAISLRAWGMHVTDTAGSYPAGSLPYGGNAPSTGALWATYDNNGAVRFDAIYRRDLLNTVPFYHVDGDVSGPVSHQLRWYAGAEDRQRVRYLDIGLRFASP